MNLAKVIQSGLDRLPEKGRIVVACSGGVDSVALLHLLKSAGCDLVVAHFNHGWRGAESDRDQELVQRLAQGWGLPFEIARGKRAAQGNAEDQARRERYLFLEAVRQKHGARWIAVAQHRDDQVETILMHQRRGAGLRGLAGMPFRRGPVFRPLLQVPKADLVLYAKAHALEWREDRSNQDLGLARNRLRQVEIPALKAQDPAFEEKILRKSQEARYALERLEEEAQAWLRKKLKGNAFCREAFAALSSDLQGEALIQLLGPVDLYRSTLSRLRNWIQQGHSGTRLTVKGRTFWLEQESVFLEPACRQLLPLKKIRLTRKEAQWGSWRISNMTGEVLFARPWQPGDRFRPSGMRGSKKVQDFFTDAKIPKRLRPGIPLIVNEKNDIISIGPLRFSALGESLKPKLQIHELPCAP